MHEGFSAKSVMKGVETRALQLAKKFVSVLKYMSHFDSSSLYSQEEQREGNVSNYGIQIIRVLAWYLTEFRNIKAQLLTGRKKRRKFVLLCPWAHSCDFAFSSKWNQFI